MTGDNPPQGHSRFAIPSPHSDREHSPNCCIFVPPPDEIRAHPENVVGARQAAEIAELRVELERFASAGFVDRLTGHGGRRVLNLERLRLGMTVAAVRPASGVYSQPPRRRYNNLTASANFF